MDYIHEPVVMHYVLDSLQQLPVPHVFVVRLVVEAVNNCGGRVGSKHLWIIFTELESDSDKIK